MERAAKLAIGHTEQTKTEKLHGPHRQRYEGCRRFLRTGGIYKMAKAVFQVEKLFQRHVQEAVKLAQHLLRSLQPRAA